MINFNENLKLQASNKRLFKLINSDNKVNYYYDCDKKKH